MDGVSEEKEETRLDRSVLTAAEAGYGRVEVITFFSSLLHMQLALSGAPTPVQLKIYLQFSTPPKLKD